MKIVHPQFLEAVRAAGRLKQSAAELAVADIRELLERMRGYQQQFENIFRHRMEEYYRRLAELKSRVQRVSPETQLLEKRMRLAELSNSLEQAMQNKLSDRKHSLNLPLLKLQQGYSYTEGPNGKAVTGIDEVTEGERLRIHVTDGVYTAVVEGREKIKKRI